MHVQRKSYERFLQSSRGFADRKNHGLENLFRSIFPITDQEGRASLEYMHYQLSEPKYDTNECIQRGVTYSSPLLVTLRLIIFEEDEESKQKEIKSIKEQEVYLGEVPLMTDSGTFIINGAQRVIVSQIHRSPGVFYTHDGGKNSATGKYLYSARVIPYRGSWLDIEFDAKDLIYFRIDRKRKLPVSTLLRALGYTSEQMLAEFYQFRKFVFKGDFWITRFNIEDFAGTKARADIIDAETGVALLKADIRVTPRLIKEIKTNLDNKIINYRVSSQELIGRYSAKTINNPKTGEEIIGAGREITSEILDTITAVMGLNEIELLDIDEARVGSHIRNTMMLDKNVTKENSLIDIYRVLRPGEPTTPEAAEIALQKTFFDPNKYDLSAVGRMKINVRHCTAISEEQTYLSKEDIIAIVKTITQLRDGKGEVDDIDSLENRRIRSVGELVKNQFRLGLVRVERIIIERLHSSEVDNIMPYDLISYKTLISTINEFFGSSQLSQFMDQVNPISEVTHKRRISALGPGGLTRDRAGFEVRDVHTSHYGRICPIETPEGQNIGLISSPATYTGINDYGFLETPYRKVKDCKVTDDIVYFSAIEERKYAIAQANASLNSDKSFIDEMVVCRKAGEFVSIPREEVDYIDISPKQIVSVAASLIPFLENNDANRALMGSNMQRQAVPLIRNCAPLVGTGMESIVARDSGVVVIARRNGIVEQVSSNRIVIRTEDKDVQSLGVDIYNLVKYQKSNQGTCINQRPIVKVGDKIRKGDIIADGPCTDLGELALGQNVLVAFMPWNGYNFEDSILISERLIKDDVYTSIHIEEYEIIVRDTRLGSEDITRYIPNVSEESMQYLDEDGIVYVGAEVKADDILVGKVTPKIESTLTPEEKLLRAIFGEKASEVKDSSLRVPPGVKGTVIGVRIFTRRGVQKNERAIVLERIAIDKLNKDINDQIKIFEDFAFDHLEGMLINQTVLSAPSSIKNKLPTGTKITQDNLNGINRKLCWQISVDDNKINEEIVKLRLFLDKTNEELEKNLKRNIEKIKSGEDLPQGALKVVKVYIATKLKLQQGDKMAGRHGNKGVVSKIIPVEDMPFMEDGTPIDIVLNPLGVPSRMNVGQILETHLGWASVNFGKQISHLINEVNKRKLNIEDLRKKLEEIYNNGLHSESVLKIISQLTQNEVMELGQNLKTGVPFSTPVFDGAREDDIDAVMKKAGVSVCGQVKLIDGKTGEYFQRKVTVGSIYMMKLDHLVDNKMHARSTGPYSLVTQQPLGGKSHFGGQRFGEMECWALQAYGASYVLQEMITVKSDDVKGRVKVYESLVKGDASFECGIPESFNVMVKELRSLCLDIELSEDKEEIEEEEIYKISEKNTEKM